jgi:quinoprotein glucose dehydrogenase
MKFLIATLLGGLILPALLAQRSSGADWPTFNRDLASTRYSPLRQINAGNVAKLALAWSYRPSDHGGKAAVESMPIVVNGVMYLPTGNRVVALEPETGREIWHYDLEAGLVAGQRGVAYWPGDRNNPPRIIFPAGQGPFVTYHMNFKKLVALNANTGRLDPGFGKEGVVDMPSAYGGVPTIFKNVVMVGAHAQEHEALGMPGDSRAFDARTGARLWEFHSVPRPGETGHDTWEGDSWKDRSGTNMWTIQATVDEARGIVYMPFGAPSSTYYGGDRRGDNLFGNALVAIDAATGKYKWHFQTIHHDIWDYDLPPAPTLFDLTLNGRKIPALAQAGKTGLMFILDRVTGKPIFGVEERAVPRGDVPGEWYSPTQPFPLKPPPLARTSFKEEDLVTEADTTPGHAKACRELYEKYRGAPNPGIFTPWFFRPDGAPPRSTIVFPGFTGGTNWGGTALDPRTGFIYSFTQDLANIGWIESYPNGYHHAGLGETNRLPYDMAGPGGPGPSSRFAITPRPGRLLPCQKPPWGRLNAVNANTGEIAWQVTVGITDEFPEGKQNTGRPGNAGPMVTAGGLVFLGVTDDARFRAFDAKTGRELWGTRLDHSANAIPMTYRGKNGKQYVAVMAAGAPTGSPETQALMVYSLP